jgi:hypothetical protein
MAMRASGEAKGIETIFPNELSMKRESRLNWRFAMVRLAMNASLIGQRIRASCGQGSLLH